MKTLGEVKVGESARIVKLHGGRGFGAQGCTARRSYGNYSARLRAFC